MTDDCDEDNLADLCGRGRGQVKTGQVNPDGPTRGATRAYRGFLAGDQQKWPKFGALQRWENSLATNRIHILKNGFDSNWTLMWTRKATHPRIDLVHACFHTLDSLAKGLATVWLCVHSCQNKLDFKESMPALALLLLNALQRPI